MLHIDGNEKLRPVLDIYIILGVDGDSGKVTMAMAALNKRTDTCQVKFIEIISEPSCLNKVLLVYPFTFLAAT
jgi:hypothetical protein